MERRSRSDSSRCPNLGGKEPRVWCGPCYENIRRGMSHQGHLRSGGRKVTKSTYQNNPYTEYLSMRREESTKQKATKYKPPTDKFWDKYPNLAQVLTDCWWDDGQPREVPQLSINLFTDSVRLSIVDISGRRSTNTDAPNIVNALELVEALCSGPGLPWRHWGSKKGK